MKKILLVSTLTLMSAAALAEGTYEPMVDHFSGAYLGAGLGYGQNIVDSYSRAMTFTSGTTSNVSRSGISKGGFAGQVFAGYGQVFDNQFYLGGDIFYQYTNPKATESAVVNNSTGTLIDSLQMTVKQQNSLGLAAHLGYVMHDEVMPYFLIGGQYTSVKSSVSSAVSATGFDVNGSNSFNKWGLLIGAGMQMHVKDNWLAGLEYDYAYRGKVTQTITPGTTGVLSGGSFSQSYRPNLSTIMARVAYRFDM